MLDTKLQCEANETNFVLWICQSIASNQLPSLSLKVKTTKTTSPPTVSSLMMVKVKKTNKQTKTKTEMYFKTQILRNLDKEERQ